MNHSVRSPHTRAASQKKRDGRSSDLTCSWLTRTYGKEWEEWRFYGESWLEEQNYGLDKRLSALSFFFERYLVQQHLPAKVRDFLAMKQRPCIFRLLKQSQNHSTASTTNNRINDFLQWIILRDFVTGNVPMFDNPFPHQKATEFRRSESVYDALPYHYIKELSSILCPDPAGDFRDWIWAQKQLGYNRVHGFHERSLGDWFVVDKSLINYDDPDCVWRVQRYKKGENVGWGRRQIFVKEDREQYEMWCPARAVALYLKLQLPLRTIQVRLLDSGESDTYRLENGNWILNTKHDFVRGSKRKPYAGGVFKRLLDQGQALTGLYVNSNKTADMNREDLDRGYTIPYCPPQVAYWLEKLRNWQEKYNPIDGPLPCTELDHKHFGRKKSDLAKQAMGSCCFLFRTANAKGEGDKPLPKSSLDRLWNNLLQTLEENCAARNECYADGTGLKFVYPKKSIHASGRNYYPLHSLRVSLITCYATEGGLPPKVLSAMLAGHARLEMTYYYEKLNPGQYHNIFTDAERRLQDSSPDSLKLFLKNGQKDELSSRVACLNMDALYSSISNRNPSGWSGRHIGLCLVGGNTQSGYGDKPLNGCWNGGPVIGRIKNPKKIEHQQVSNGPENCIRCRFFVTDATYIPQLVAHFNSLSYRAVATRDLAREHEDQVEALEKERSRKGAAFDKKRDLDEAQALMERESILADELIMDMTATYQMVVRIMEIEKKKGSKGPRLVAVGERDDLEIGFRDLDTELSQIASICADAEVFANEADSLLKTPAIGKIADKLNMALIREGYSPVLMNMDDRMKLATANAMMKAMASKINPDAWRYEGLSVVAGMLEAGASLSAQGLLDEGLLALEGKLDHPVYRLGSLVGKAAEKP